jgi:hypothetical protein
MLEKERFPPRVVTLMPNVEAHCSVAETSSSEVGKTTALGTGLSREFQASVSFVQVLFEGSDVWIPAVDRHASRLSDLLPGKDIVPASVDVAEIARRNALQLVFDKNITIVGLDEEKRSGGVAEP